VAVVQDLVVVWVVSGEKMKPLLLMLATVALLTAIGCENSGSPAVAAASSQPTATTSATAQTQQNPMVVATGPIVVENQVDVLALRGGVVSAIQVDIGKAVRKGDLLAMLDDRQIVAERDAAAAKVRSAEANLKDWQAETEVADADYRRAEAMRKAGINTQEELEHAHYKLIGSQFEIEKAKQDLSTAQDSLHALELEMEKTRITAPFDGIVARRYVRVGQDVTLSQRLFWVSAVAPLQVKFTLPESFLPKMKKGQILSVDAANIPSAVEHAARVIDVSPVVDPASGTIEVMAQIEGAAPDLRPGMLANIRMNP
jgi:membrane fusion protein, multidrug efflux system